MYISRSPYTTIVFQNEICSLSLGGRTWQLQTSQDHSDCVVIDYPNAQMLIDIYSNLHTESEKDEFIESLCENLSRANDRVQVVNKKWVYISIAPITFYTLVRLGFSSRAIDSFGKGAKSNLYGPLLEFLVDLFHESDSYFTILDIGRLIDVVKSCKEPGVEWVSQKEMLNIVLSSRGKHLIGKEIQGVNLEINRDKESVIRIARGLGLDPEYETFLNQLDDYIATSSGLVASGMIGNFREFWERIIIDLSQKIVMITGVEIVRTDRSRISDARQYIKSELTLSDADNELITKYVGILHAKGGHSFTSDVEYFRLSRNIGIEILLLLLTKVEGLKTKAIACRAES